MDDQSPTTDQSQTPQSGQQPTPKPAVNLEQPIPSVTPPPPVIPTPPVVPTSETVVPPPISDFEESSFFSGKLILLVGIGVLILIVATLAYFWQSGALFGTQKTQTTEVSQPVKVAPPPPPPERLESGFNP